jgi:transposase
MKTFSVSRDFVKLPTSKWFEPRSWSWRMSIPTGPTTPSLERWAAPFEQSVNGEDVGARLGRSKTGSAREPRAFSPSSVRAQITALACTLPRESGKPFSLWSCPELVKAAKARKIVSDISVSTVRQWLQQDKIKPWQYRSWQQPTDPRFLEKAIPILRLYERAQRLATVGHIVVCADEKTSIQARKTTGGMHPARPGSPARIGDRYQRKGALQLFAALLVHTGETLARCLDRKRFCEFQLFLQTLFSSLWCKKIRVLHLILDNGPTHAPKQIKAWIKGLGLPFRVKIHWLPIHASWLDQVEIVFSDVQRRVLAPNHFQDTSDLKKSLMAHFTERNRRPKPIRWTYTAEKAIKMFGPKIRHAELARAA